MSGSICELDIEGEGMVLAKNKNDCTPSRNVLGRLKDTRSEAQRRIFWLANFMKTAEGGKRGPM